MTERHVLELPGPADALERAQQLVENATVQLEPEDRCAVELAVVELVENLTKYAAPEQLGAWATITLELTPRHVQIKVASGSEDNADSRQAEELIALGRDAIDQQWPQIENALEFLS